ncbi:MAG: ATP-binding cassette domain-containing protein [Candidatus Omnitrophica bacterium]|nr:ATP-binding cassette domain-containing protein [Candidatus Omnitrophota bacterium]
MNTFILEAKNLSKRFSVERGFFKKEEGAVNALSQVSFTVNEFDTLGIVGESGSGKTTLAKIIARLIPPTSGEVIFNENIITDFRKDVQIIFQNPYNSLNPKMRVKDIITEPLLIHKMAKKKYLKQRAVEMLETVGLGESALDRYPGAFSGGQRQRICIARALACEPKLLILDEPISSLDLTIQAKLLDLFVRLKDKFRFTYIFISHNLAVIKNISNSVIVMQDGRVAESSDTSSIFERPRSIYTKNLLEAARE